MISVRYVINVNRINRRRCIINKLREKLADLVHKQWSGWMKYLFMKGTHNKDGTWTMPKWAVDRWARQMNTPYQELPEEEKDTDRGEADKFLEVFQHYHWNIIEEDEFGK